MTLKKRLKPISKSRSAPPVAEQVYEGELPSATEYRDGLLMVSLDSAPDVPQFPKCDPKGVPPKTFYVFDPEKGRCVHMLSFDAYDIGIAWDTDRDGRYFLRARRALLCPRYVEYSYDASEVIKAGGYWSRSHPNYSGTLSASVSPGVYADYQSPRTRADARKKPLKRSGSLTRPRTLPKAADAPRKRLGGRKTTDHDINDQAATDQAAREAAADLTASFGKKKLRKASR